MASSVIIAEDLLTEHRMAKPAFIYAFDNLGPYRFVELCGEIFGSMYKGFLLGGEGPDGGIDGEIDKILGEWHPEEHTVLANEIIYPGQTAIFQFKHKVTARVGQSEARTQLLGLYNCNTQASNTKNAPKTSNANNAKKQKYVNYIEI